MPTGTTRNQQNTCGLTGSGGKFNQFLFEILGRFKRQFHGGQQLAQTTVEITQSGFQLGFHFSIFNLFRRPVPIFIKQAKLIGVGETRIFGMQFDPPTPEFALLWSGLNIDAHG